MKLDGGDTLLVGQPIVGTVPGDASTRVVLVREASSDLSGTKAEELATSQVVEGRFRIDAPDAPPSYAGATLRYGYRLSVRDGDRVRVEHPVTLVLPDNAPLLASLWGVRASLTPMSWASTVGIAVALLLGGGAGLAYGLTRGSPVPIALGVLGALAAAGLAVWIPLSRYRTHTRGWVGQFDGLSPEPSFSLPLLKSDAALERLETRVHIRCADSATDYRPGQPHVLEAFLEHNPRCRDVRAVQLELEITETRAVRSRTAGPDPKTQWIEHHHALFTGSAPLRPAAHPPLHEGRLEVPKGLPPATWIDDWGGIQWRYRFCADTTEGPMQTRWKTLRVRSYSSAPPST